MNQQPDLGDGQDDPLEEALAPLRAATPPGWVRAANQRAAALAAQPRAVLPWWRRSVEAPLPVVAATAAALLITTTTSLWRWRGAEAPVTPSPPAAQNHIEPTWTVTQTYLGSLQSLRNPSSILSPEAPENDES